MKIQVSAGRQYHVTIPKALVNAMNLKKGEVLKPFLKKGSLVLKRKWQL